MSNIGASGVIMLVLIALLLFGPNKLPELGRAVGKTLREFKKGANEMMSDDSQTHKEVAPREQLTQPKKDGLGNRDLPE